MLRMTPTQSAENSPLSMDRAKNAEIGNGTSSTTRSAENLSISMEVVEDAKVGWGNDGDDETVNRSPLFKKLNVSIKYLTSLYSKKIWVSLDSFWLLLKLSVKGTIEKAIKQNSRWATQGSYPNQSLQKLTLYKYNTLSFYQVFETYELFQYHSTLIIKLQLLDTSIPLNIRQCLHYRIFISKTHFFYSCISSAIYLNQANRQRLLLGLRPENLPILSFWDVTLLRLPMFLKSSERSFKTIK